MRPISHCLNSQLLKLCQRTVQLDELNYKLKAYLPSSLSAHCQVGSFNRGCLMITTSNAWATELRYLLPELRDKLRSNGLYQLSSLKINIVELSYTTQNAKLSSKIALSTTARDHILAIQDSCSYPPLKKALYQLANRNKPTTL